MGFLLLCFLACLINLLNAQGTAEGCVTCALADFFTTGLEEWILPAAGALQFFQPDSAPDTSIPKNEPDKQWTNNLPGSSDQSDIENESVASPDEKCNPNGPKVSVIPAALADICTTLATLTIFVSILAKFLRRGNSSDNLAFTRLLRRRGPS